ncbi:MAG: hypothetical protein H6736_01105 [Alphaproteobacteria bacterium]|nr:hypothetical protein [Alphaproteobacteria bacterium]MCB9690390.1 hypothetical protein [Alphaproteobacteria bacterium]
MSEPRDDGAIVAEMLGAVVRRIVRRGRVEVERAAESSRRRLELRQLRKDRDHFWMRLGKTAQQLVLAGEIDHPALRKAMERIEAIEAELDRAAGGAPLATPEGSDYTEGASGSRSPGV